MNSSPNSLRLLIDPYHREMFHAEKGKGAFCNGERIKVSGISGLGKSLLATGFPYAKDDMERNNLIEFNRFLPGIQCIRRMGSAALDLCYVASGRIDGYWEPLLKPWDTAAGSLIVQEAGGIVTKYNGGDYDRSIPLPSSTMKIPAITAIMINITEIMAVWGVNRDLEEILFFTLNLMFFSA